MSRELTAPNAVYTDAGDRLTQDKSPRTVGVRG